MSSTVRTARLAWPRAHKTHSFTGMKDETQDRNAAQRLRTTLGIGHGASMSPPEVQLEDRKGATAKVGARGRA